jgi:hypothetical protein
MWRPSSFAGRMPLRTLSTIWLRSSSAIAPMITTMLSQFQHASRRRMILADRHSCACPFPESVQERKQGRQYAEDDDPSGRLPMD